MMRWYSNVVCTGLLILTVLVSASVGSSLTCKYEELDGNCATTNNCTNRTTVHFLNPDKEINCTNIQNGAKHICNYASSAPKAVELGVKIPEPNEKEYFRIPDKNMDASTNERDASRARIGMKSIGPYNAAWCADKNDPDKWLEVKFDVAAVIEKIEIKGHPMDSSKWVENFTLKYEDSSGNHTMTFNSSQNGSCHYVFINRTTKVRIYSNSSAGRTCLQLAIYGSLPRDATPSPVVPVVPVDPTNKEKNLDSASIAKDEFFKGYLLWAVFVALLIFLVIFTLAFLLCWCCRRNYPLKSAMEKSKEVNPYYVPAWRRVDAKAEKGYIATQETQEVKIAFTDEYIPPGLQKEKQDPNDEKFYRHRIFSFSGCQPTNTHTAQEHLKATQENSTNSK